MPNEYIVISTSYILLKLESGKKEPMLCHFLTQHQENGVLRAVSDI